jgi:hypothetical protein
MVAELVDFDANPALLDGLPATLQNQVVSSRRLPHLQLPADDVMQPARTTFVQKGQAHDWY